MCVGCGRLVRRDWKGVSDRMAIAVGATVRVREATSKRVTAVVAPVVVRLIVEQYRGDLEHHRKAPVRT